MVVCVIDVKKNWQKVQTNLSYLIGDSHQFLCFDDVEILVQQDRNFDFMFIGTLIFQNQNCNILLDFIKRKELSFIVGMHFFSMTQNVEINENKIMFFVKKNDILVLDINEIIYMESNLHTTIINSSRDVYIVQDKLSDIYEKVKKKEFIQCHKSYIINPAQVRFLDKKNFYMNNGCLVPVSRRYYKKTKIEFEKWCNNNTIF